MSRATFLMTSNIGAHIFDKEHRLGFVKARTHDDFTKEIRAELRKELRPEFLNRIDEVLVYFPLETDDLLQIGRRTLASLQQRFARRGIWLTVADDVYSFLVERVVGREGARSLQRLTEKLIARPLTELLLSSDDFRMVEVVVSDGSICVQALQMHQQEV
jgi:ATP-dependent Clp protease ATP-binding subunit ClpC